MHRLQRHLDPQFEVDGAPDLTHPAPPDPLAHVIALPQNPAGFKQYL
jgi:hypothetical protein